MEKKFSKEHYRISNRPQLINHNLIKEIRKKLMSKEHVIFYSFIEWWKGEKDKRKVLLSKTVSSHQQMNPNPPLPSKFVITYLERWRYEVLCPSLIQHVTTINISYHVANLSWSFLPYAMLKHNLLIYIK